MAPGIEVREAVDGYIVYNHQDDRLHFLNATAAFLLQCCDGRVRAKDLPGILATAFELDEEPEADVEACLESLLAENLLVAASSSPPKAV